MRTAPTTYRNRKHRLLPGDPATGMRLMLQDACRFTWNEIEEARELQYSHAFVARGTRTTDEGVVWHGYPEAWDRMDLELKKRWRGKD